MKKSSCSSDRYIEVSKVLKTIAHPVKLEILQLLGRQEPLDVSTMQETLGCDCRISMLSHHLSKLKDNGVVYSEKKGKQVFYSLTDRNILSIFDCIDSCELTD